MCSLTCPFESKSLSVILRMKQVHYFPDEDSVRERYFRGTANKMIGGVLVRQTRFMGGS